MSAEVLAGCRPSACRLPAVGRNRSREPSASPCSMSPRCQEFAQAGLVKGVDPAAELAGDGDPAVLLPHALEIVQGKARQHVPHPLLVTATTCTQWRGAKTRTPSSWNRRNSRSSRRSAGSSNSSSLAVPSRIMARRQSSSASASRRGSVLGSACMTIAPACQRSVECIPADRHTDARPNLLGAVEVIWHRSRTGSAHRARPIPCCSSPPSPRWSTVRARRPCPSSSMSDNPASPARSARRNWRSRASRRHWCSPRPADALAHRCGSAG